jgi:RHS repeat-associated protein
VAKANADQDHRRQFNGKENDALTSLRYYGYRYYDPLTLRWNSADPLHRFAPDLDVATPQAMNLYSFSLNNPARYLDPDGRQPEGGEGFDECALPGETDVCWGLDTSDEYLSEKEHKAPGDSDVCEAEEPSCSTPQTNEPSDTKTGEQGTAAASTVAPSGKPPPNGGVLRKLKDAIVKVWLGGKLLIKGAENAGRDPGIDVDADGNLEIKGDKQKLEEETRPSSEEAPGGAEKSEPSERLLVRPDFSKTATVIDQPSLLTQLSVAKATGNMDIAKAAVVTGTGVAAGIGLWELAKWTVAVLAAPETGGASLLGAAATP